ncbi:MAG TPA: ATP-binding protein [Candidatus Bathyarchaeia archaeon]|nr:ATP-binding protein [Candidatus Bathyarchaeia archaeon]
MMGRRSLRSSFTWLFAATLMLLYGVAATSIWMNSRASARQFAILTLKAEGETVAGYLATTGRLDAPEFKAPEATPFPIWFRLFQRDRVLAQTPGSPELLIKRTGPARHEVVTEWSPVIGGPYLTLYHEVGGAMEGAILQLIAPTSALDLSQYRLAGVLFLVGLVVIPLAALGGRRLAQHSLRPLDELVAGIRALDSGRLSDRLALPTRAVDEVAVLSKAFNDLLERLEASVDTMRRFTADASHEVRNPLSVLRTGLEVALRRPRAAADYRALIEENLQEILRLQSVLDGLLALTREVPGSPWILTKAPVDFSRLLEETADTFATVAAEREVTIQEDITPQLVVEGDAQMLRLIAFNLIDNAVKHSPAGETVRITASGREAEIEILVADRGPGVAPENRERLFRRFFRADRASGPGIGGLGLNVVRWVSEIHGGSVRLLDSDRGAVFQVVLPAQGPGRARGQREETPAAPMRQT